MPPPRVTPASSRAVRDDLTAIDAATITITLQLGKFDVQHDDTVKFRGLRGANGKAIAFEFKLLPGHKHALQRKKESGGTSAIVGGTTFLATCADWTSRNEALINAPRQEGNTKPSPWITQRPDQTASFDEEQHAHGDATGIHGTAELEHEDRIQYEAADSLLDDDDQSVSGISSTLVDVGQGPSSADGGPKGPDTQSFTGESSSLKRKGSGSPEVMPNGTGRSPQTTQLDDWTVSLGDEGSQPTMKSTAWPTDLETTSKARKREAFDTIFAKVEGGENSSLDAVYQPSSKSNGVLEREYEQRSVSLRPSSDVQDAPVLANKSEMNGSLLVQKQQQQNVIDLTIDDGVDIKQERLNEYRPFTNPQVIDEDEDDEEDLRLELREIEIKRKLRAMGRKKQGPVKAEY